MRTHRPDRVAAERADRPGRHGDRERRSPERPGFWGHGQGQRGEHDRRPRRLVDGRHPAGRIGLRDPCRGHLHPTGGPDLPSAHGRRARGQGRRGRDLVQRRGHALHQRGPRRPRAGHREPRRRRLRHRRAAHGPEPDHQPAGRVPDPRHHRERLRGRHRRRRAGAAEHRRGHRHTHHHRRPLRRREPAHHRRARDQHRLRARAADPARRRSTPPSTSSPPSGDESKVDVNLVGAPAVDTGTVGYEFISGICDGDTFLIGDIVNAVAGPQIQALIGDGFATNLGDPDGAGPADSPIADAIETALGRDLDRRVGRRGHPGPPRRAVHPDQRDRDRHRLPGRRRLLRHARCHARPTARRCPERPTSPRPSTCPAAYPTLGATTPGGQPVRPRPRHLRLGVQPAARDHDRVRDPQPVDHRDRARRWSAAADHLVTARRARARVRHRACLPARRCASC